MAKFKRRDNATLVTGGWQAYIGSGTLVAAVMDGTDLSSNVITLYDSPRASTSDDTIATWTQDTDFGTTVPVRTVKDGSVVATLATVSANTHAGVPFADGLFLNKTGDTTHNAALKLLIKPLIKKRIQIGHGATTDTNVAFRGPGILHGVRIRLSPTAIALGTLDILIKDGTAGTTSDRTIVTATDYANATGGLGKIWSPVTTTGIDDAGTAVTTAATGSYVNDGVAFVDGLTVTSAQGSASGLNAEVDLLIEA